MKLIDACLILEVIAQVKIVIKNVTFKKMFLKEISYAHQGCNCEKKIYNLQIYDTRNSIRNKKQATCKKTQNKTNKNNARNCTMPAVGKSHLYIKRPSLDQPDKNLQLFENRIWDKWAVLTWLEKGCEAGFAGTLFSNFTHLQQWKALSKMATMWTGRLKGAVWNFQGYWWSFYMYLYLFKIKINWLW